MSAVVAGGVWTPTSVQAVGSGFQKLKVLRFEDFRKWFGKFHVAGILTLNPKPSNPKPTCWQHGAASDTSYTQSRRSVASS